MNLNRLDLNLLVALDALLTERSITHAAERLNLSPSATSGALARLRTYFDDELLTQIGRRMAPTPLGESLQASVRECLLHVQATVEIRPQFDPLRSTRTCTPTPRRKPPTSPRRPSAKSPTISPTRSDCWEACATRIKASSAFTSANNDPFFPALAQFGSLAENNWSGLVGVQYSIAPDVKSYFKVVRGYKGPQVTPAAQGSPQTVIGAEIPTEFELGIKGTTLGRRLTWDGDIFYSRVHDYQGQACSINPVGALVCVGQSVPEVVTKGIELNLYGQITTGLSFNAGYVYDIAKYPNGYTGYDPNNLLGGTTDLSNQQVVGVPKNKVSLSGEYAHAIGDAVQAFVSADTVYKSAMRLGPTADPRFVFPQNWNTGLRLGVRAPSDQWSVALFARNLGKDREPVTLFGGPSFTPPGVNPGAPAGGVNGISGWATVNSLRQVGITADVKF